jgi:hypothetical protein
MKRANFIRIVVLAGLLMALVLPVANSVLAGDDCYWPGGDCDGDKVINIDDNCMWEPNANQRDSDRDEIGDACDKEPCVRNDHHTYGFTTSKPKVDLSCFEKVEPQAEAGEPAFDDNRLNQRAGDAAAPLAVYCNGLGGFDVYWINENAGGELVIRTVERQVVEGQGLIEQAEVPGGVIEVYKLEDGTFQVNWSGCQVVYEA